MEVQGDVSRLVVIDWRKGTGHGRVFDQKNIAIIVDVQDDGQTMKVFVVDPESPLVR